jgi:hypothetical protein
MNKKKSFGSIGSLSEENAPLFHVVEGGICDRCVHYKVLTVSCAAFPKGIPSVILLGKFIHTEPYPGDRGIRFEAKKEPRP